MKTKWEYQALDFNLMARGPSRADFLNEQGRQGWELVFVLGPCFYFKRPVAVEAAAA